MSEEITIKEPPVLFDQTQQILHDLTAVLQAPVLTYWNGFRGSVCNNDVMGFYELLETIGTQETVYLFIKSDGGNGKASLRIANLIRRYAKQLVALVPLQCASAATMLTLAADEVMMGPMAYLTAVDTSLTHDLSPIDRDNDRVSVSLDELQRVVKLWQAQSKRSDEENPYRHLFEYVHPLVIGAVDRAESLSIMLCEELLSYHIQDRDQIHTIAETLNSKYPSHGYPILLDEARRIGLNVTTMPAEVNELLLRLNLLYSEMGQKATTDFDEVRSHSNEILNILETAGKQIFYQNDKDWFYRSEERRWITMNDNSSWRKTERVGDETRKSILHIA
ncbi:MAG: ATP-dependent Clp protease proteolytic subunit [Planctomycetaceae bacterium]|nr:ATP-dependent Clp protease proteolytic subunit [Planctomycetaceae bacterium]